MSGMLTRSRAFSTEGLKVINNVARKQFLITLKGVEAALDYEKAGKDITYVHTNVPKEFQGKGVGKLLAQYALDHAVQNKLDVTCKCHFIAKYYENNSSKYKGLNIKFDLEDE